MKEDLVNTEKQYEDLEKIVDELRTHFQTESKYSFAVWNHADFVMSDSGDFIEYADLQKIDSILRKHKRNIVLITPLPDSGPEGEAILEIVTVKSGDQKRKKRAPGKKGTPRERYDLYVKQTKRLGRPIDSFENWLRKIK